MPPARIHAAAASGFARAPADYDRGRPDYPPAAVEYLLGALGVEPDTPVLDLAAGTGKLTRRLVAAGADVVAVEPVAEMRAALAESLPQVQAAPGAAEAIPLADGAVAAVTVGQAFHWFDGDLALAEIHRVLVPGGRLGVVWNMRSGAKEWVARLTALMEPYRGQAPRAAAGAWKDAFERTRLFTPLEHAAYEFEQPADEATVVARVASVSFIAALPGAEHAGVLEAVRELVRTHPETRGPEGFPFPYRTDVFTCTRLEGAAGVSSRRGAGQPSGPRRGQTRRARPDRLRPASR